MKKLISIVLMTMILCSLFTVPALAEDAQGQEAGSAETATMSVTGGTINPDGTVSWAVGENILTITMPDGSTYTVTVIYNPEAASPAALTTLTVSGTEIPMTGNAAAAVTPNAADTIAVVTEPADAAVTVNGTAVENGEITYTWEEGRNELAIEVSKEGFETTAYTLTVEYTPVKEEAAPEDTATPEEAPEQESEAVPKAETAPAADETAATEDTAALAALTVDTKEIDLDKFVKGASDEKQTSFSFNAAAEAEYDLASSAGTVVVTAAEGWTVSSVKLNGADLTAVAADTYSPKWAKANDLEITLKKNDTEMKAVYSLILNNTLAEATVDALTVNGTDVTFQPAIQAAADNSYTLQVSAAGKTVTVFVNGIPTALDANGMLLVPAVTGEADSVVVIVSQDGFLDKAYSVTVTVSQAGTIDQAATEPVVDAATDNVAGEASGEAVETAENTGNPEMPV